MTLTLATCLSLNAAPLALEDGEKMTFQVSWGIFRHAGELVIAADNVHADGNTHLRITTTASSDGIVKAFYPFVATSEAYFDPSTGLLLRSNDVSETRKESKRQTLTLDYDKHVASYIDENDPNKSKELEVPPGRPMDLMMSLVQTRAWDLKPGEQQDALVLFDDEFYELTLHADRYETLRTPLGKFKTLVLLPVMEKTEPKGMFKRGSTVRVWVSQDKERLPVRIEVKFKFGTGVITLVDHQIVRDGAKSATPPKEVTMGDRPPEAAESRL